MEKGVPIRSVSRALVALQAINRCGSLSLMEIARATGVPYPTAHRLVQTLLYQGFIECEPSRKRYRCTALVLSLAVGFQHEDRLVEAARPHILGLTRRLGWPVSISTRVGKVMMLRDTTHATTSLTFDNYYAGFTLPILECASGKLLMAYSSAKERKSILQSVRMSPEDMNPQMLALAEGGVIFDEIRRNGYATQGKNRYTVTPGKTSSIAVPILRDGKIMAAMTLIFFAKAMKIEDAVVAYLEDMRRTAADIMTDLSEDQPPTSLREVGASPRPLGERPNPPRPSV
jgi:IclR family mhp operon transcriptional activator